MNTVRKITSSTQLRPKSGPQTAGVFVDTTGATPRFKHDADGTVRELVDLGSAQTLASKTLTSPTVNTPTLAGGTLTGASIVASTAGNYFPGQDAITGTTKQLSSTESGRTFVINNGGDNCVITLPTPPLAAEYKIVVGVAAGAGKLHQIAPNQGTEVIYESGITPAAGKKLNNTQATAKAGDSLTITGVASVGWFVTSKTGVWAREA